MLKMIIFKLENKGLFGWIPPDHVWQDISMYHQKAFLENLCIEHSVFTTTLKVSFYSWDPNAKVIYCLLGIMRLIGTGAWADKWLKIFRKYNL